MNVRQHNLVGTSSVFHSAKPEKRSSAVVTGLLAIGMALMLAITACSGGGESLNDEAARVFDVGGNFIADLTPEGAESVPVDQMLLASNRAEAAGTALRIVVAGPEGPFVSAKDIVDRYGGTAIAYQADQPTFEGASRDISAAQLDRAVGAAKLELNMGSSADAFVQVLEDEGIEPRGRSLAQLLLLILLIPAAIFMLSGAWTYVRARKKRLKRQRDFAERKAMLADWASQLAPELESLRAPVAASPDAAAQQTWHEARDFVQGIMPNLDAAHSPSDLDLAEMRISQTAIKLRDLRRTVD